MRVAQYEKFFWIVYFVTWGLLVRVQYSDILPLKILITILGFFILTLITAHFWARSDYRNAKGFGK